MVSKKHCKNSIVSRVFWQLRGKGNEMSELKTMDWKDENNVVEVVIEEDELGGKKYRSLNISIFNKKTKKYITDESFDLVCDN